MNLNKAQSIASCLVDLQDTYGKLSQQNQIVCSSRQSLENYLNKSNSAFQIYISESLKRSRALAEMQQSKIKEIAKLSEALKQERSRSWYLEENDLPDGIVVGPDLQAIDSKTQALLNRAEKLNQEIEPLNSQYVVFSRRMARFWENVFRGVA